MISLNTSLNYENAGSEEAGHEGRRHEVVRNLCFLKYCHVSC